MSQKAASKDTISKREKSESVDKITPVRDSYTRRLKAESLDPAPLEEPFARKTSDLGSPFAPAEKMVFTVPLDKWHPIDQNHILSVRKGASHFMTKETAFTIQSEQSSFRKAGGVSFAEEPPWRFPETGKASFVEIMEPSEKVFPGIKPVSFLEAAEPFSLERGNGVFAAEQPNGEFPVKGGETFFMEQTTERVDKPALVNSTLQMVFFDPDSFVLSEEAQLVLDAKY